MPELLNCSSCLVLIFNDLAATEACQLHTCLMSACKADARRSKGRARLYALLRIDHQQLRGVPCRGRPAKVPAVEDAVRRVRGLKLPHAGNAGQLQHVKAAWSQPAPAVVAGIQGTPGQRCAVCAPCQHRGAPVRNMALQAQQRANIWAMAAPGSLIKKSFQQVGGMFRVAKPETLLKVLPHLLAVAACLGISSAPCSAAPIAAHALSSSAERAACATCVSNTLSRSLVQAVKRAK